MRAGLFGCIAAASAPPAFPADWASILTLTRASAATHWDGTTYTEYASNVARLLSGGAVLYVEGSRTTYVKYHVVDNTNWTSSGTTVAENDAAAPDGNTTAARTLTASGGGRYQAVAVGAPSSGNVAISYFVRRVSADGTIDIGVNPFATGPEVTVPFSTAWSRQTGIIARSGTGFATWRLNTQTCYLWGASYEPGAFASQHIVSNAGAATPRAVDDAAVASASVPTAWRTQPWATIITPRRASTQANDTATGVLFDFGSNYSIYMDSSNRLNVDEGGVNRVQTSALTWSADQAITVEQRPADGQIIVSGATTGDGTYAGTAYSWPGSGDVQIGNNGSLTGAFFGGISIPVAA